MPDFRSASDRFLFFVETLTPSFQPTSRTWMRVPRGSSATSSANSLRPAVISTGHRRIRSSSAANSPTPTPKSQVSPPDHAYSIDHSRVLALIFPSSRLGVAGPDSVNAKGSTVGARLQNVPARVKEVPGHGVHAGAARAIAVVSTMSGADYR